MRLTDLFAAAGRPVAYYPRLRAVTGSTNATLLLCQLIYWYGQQRDSEGWILKRAEMTLDDPDGKEDPANQSIEYETGLSYKEQVAARRLLRARGLLRERRDCVEHRMYFQVNFEAIGLAWARHPKGQLPNGMAVGDRWAGGTLPSGGSLSGTYIDYTQTTAERAASPSKKEELEPSHPEDSDERVPSTPVEAMRHPDIQLFHEVCGRIPGAAHYQTVVETMRHFRDQKGEATVDYLRPFWLAWSGRRRRSDGKPYDPGSLTWLTEWALNGTVPVSGKDGAAQNDKAEVIKEVAGRKNDRAS